MNLCLLKITNRHKDHIERLSYVNSSLLLKMANFRTVPKKVVIEVRNKYPDQGLVQGCLSLILPPFWGLNPRDPLAGGGLYRLV